MDCFWGDEPNKIAQHEGNEFYIGSFYERYEPEQFSPWHRVEEGVACRPASFAELMSNSDLHEVLEWIAEHTSGATFEIWSDSDFRDQLDVFHHFNDAFVLIPNDTQAVHFKLQWC